jgi:hypothetical protein
MRQLYNYATIDSDIRIDAPKEDYTPDKIGSVSLENLQQKRNNDIQINMSAQAKGGEQLSQQQVAQMQQQKQQYQSQFAQQQMFQQQVQQKAMQQQPMQQQQQKNVRFN